MHDRVCFLTSVIEYRLKLPFMRAILLQVYLKILKWREWQVGTDNWLQAIGNRHLVSGNWSHATCNRQLVTGLTCSARCPRRMRRKRLGRWALCYCRCCCCCGTVGWTAGRPHRNSAPKNAIRIARLTTCNGEEDNATTEWRYIEIHLMRHIFRLGSSVLNISSLTFSGFETPFSGRSFIPNLATHLPYWINPQLQVAFIGLSPLIGGEVQNLKYSLS